ncbi:hypothetical protein AB0D67_37720 [Streptosporangium sp. NPDC048047]|uniref:hypothetical protein n=1 Tax=Streptosporangium sp. NPDC048047 TaxID=3155748 RepID=UPI003429AD2E
MNDHLGLDTLWKVVVFALVAGTGLVSVFSLALVGLATGRPAGRAGAALCFLLVAGGVVLGLYVMLRK